MAAPTLNSVSPASGPPGSVVTCLGAGFAAGAQVACPTLVDTTLVDAGTLTAAIPDNLVGAAGTSLAIGVYVRNPDGLASLPQIFTVVFPAVDLQTWTTVGAVVGEVPGFQRGGRISDRHIETWMRSVSQAIAGAMLQRGLSLDPATWQQADQSTAAPAAAGVLEMINRLGAAARLAGAIAGEFGTGEWGLAKDLSAAFSREMKTLQGGGYDKLFKPGAATIESGPMLAAGDMTDCDGHSTAAFRKGQVF